MMISLWSLRIRRQPRGRIGPIPVIGFFRRCSGLCFVERRPLGTSIFSSGNDLIEILF